MSDILHTLESQHVDLEMDIVRATKIHKVLKAMLRLKSNPGDEKYHFKGRSEELLKKWEMTLSPAAGEKGVASQSLEGLLQGVSLGPSSVAPDQCLTVE
ncbi:hypothetical protein MMC14_007766 [Varicellaria rhodocarpa]|nr:hypothetical protein [Varicellaria rhodocarpa]